MMNFVGRFLILLSRLFYYLKNDVYNEGSKTINVNAILNANIHIPVMTIFGNVTDSIVQVFNKKSNVPIDVLYQDPENPEFNFFVHDAWMSNQGTSSMNYPRRNFRLYLNKQATKETLRGFAPNHAYLFQTILSMKTLLLLLMQKYNVLFFNQRT